MVCTTMIDENFQINIEEHINLPDENGNFKCFVTCKDEETIINVFNDLINNDRGEGSLRNSIICDEYLYDDNFSSIFILSQEQIDELEKDPRVQQVTKLPLPKNNLCITQGLQIDKTSTNNGNDDNYALSRCCQLSSLNLPNQYTYTYTGSGVDVVIVDTGIKADHPEWRSRASGNSRLQQIDWSLFYTLTSATTQNVTLDGAFNIYLNESFRPEVLTWYHTERRNNGVSTNASPLVYSFVLPATGVAPYKFVISTTSGGTPLIGANITNNATSSGTVSLTANYNSIPTVLYYFLSGDGFNIDPGNLITPTRYNTQDLSFYTDTDGHGTHCTGTVAGSAFGWAKEANIYTMTSIDVNNGYGSTWLYGLPLVLAWHQWKQTHPSLSARPTVCSNSWRIPALGGVQAYYYPEYSSFNNVVKQMVQAGIHFVRAAGNENIRLVPFGDPLYGAGAVGDGQYSFRIGTPGWPANETTGPLVLVGATDYLAGVLGDGILSGYESKASFSTRGTAVQIFSPGTNIQSAWPTTGFATYRNGVFGSYGARKISGTSMACPQVAGMMATILEQFPTATPQELLNFIRANAITGNIYDYGSNSGTSSLCGAPNLFMYRFPGDQYYFAGKNEGNFTFNNNFYALSGSIPINLSPILLSNYNTYTHYYSSLNIALTALS